MGNANSYLYLSRHNIYYFRVIVPIGVTGDVTKQEYRKSLQTRNPQTARRRCVALRACLEELYNGKRCVMVKWSKLKQILDQELLQLIAKEKEYIENNGPRPSVIKERWLQEDLPYFQQEIDNISHSSDDEDFPLEISGAIAGAILKKNKIDLSDSHELFVKFCEATLHMYIEYHQQMCQINEDTSCYGVLPTGSANKILSDDSVTQTMISDAIESYCGEMMAGKNWTEKTHAEYLAAYRLFLDIVHDMSLADVDQHTAQHYKKTLQKLPSNMRKKAQYRDKSIQQILMMKIPKEQLLSISKVNSNISRISAFFNWALKNSYVQQNWFSGIKLKEKVADHKKRLPFTEEDLKVLFSSKEYQTGKRKHPYYYWLPLIGLYSGARINEICQLHLEDIYEENGTWVMDFCKGGDKTLKNEPSRRKTPIHSRLIELGLRKYVNQLKKKGEKRLFPELKKGRDGYSQSASKWFGRYRRRYGITDKCKPFHSFRHTVIDYLKQRGYQTEKIKAIVGHKDESITTGLYGKPYEPASLAPIVEKLEFSVDVPAYF